MKRPAKAIDQDGLATLEDMIGPDMPEVVAEIIDTYLEESVGLLEAIANAKASNNRDAMLRPVHSLKSSSASVGALYLSSLAAELEQFIRGFGPELDVDRYVRDISDEYQRVDMELREISARYTDAS